MDGMEQFTHDSAYSLQGRFSVGDEMFEEASHIGIMCFGAQGRQKQGRTDMVISRLGEAGTLVHTCSGLEVARVQAGGLDPLLVGQPRGQ